MRPFRIEITVPIDGEVHLRNIPFAAGEKVEVTIHHLSVGEEHEPANGSSQIQRPGQFDSQTSANLDEDDPLDREIDAYEEMHPELVEKYLDLYVAIFEGEVIDLDADQWKLLTRLDANYPDEIVLVRKVESELPGPIYIRSPHFMPVR